MGLPNATPIPQRFPPLTWRQPVLIWTPAALVLSLGWPAMLLGAALANVALIAGAIVFAMSFVSMGAAWVMGSAPRTRREIVLHVVACGMIVAILAPFVVVWLLNAVADAEHLVTGIRPATPYFMMPFAVLLGLPVAFFYGVVFSCVALVKQPNAIMIARKQLRDERVGAGEDVLRARPHPQQIGHASVEGEEILAPDARRRKARAGRGEVE